MTIFAGFSLGVAALAHPAEAKTPKTPKSPAPTSQMVMAPQPTPAPGSGGAAERLTRKGLALGDRTAAEFNYYVQALQANPHYAPARLHLAEWYRAHKQDDAALQQYLAALAAEPDFPAAHFSLAEFLWHSKANPTPAEGNEPRHEIKPSIRRMELARYHIQAYLDLMSAQQSQSFTTEARIMLAAIEGDLAKEKNAQPLSHLSWDDAARRLSRPADPAHSPYEGPRLALKVEFARGSAAISHGSTYLLDAVARALASDQLQNAHVLIEGHADSEGDSKANLLLSKKRAQSVRDYFISRGLASDRFLMAGYGAHRPLVPNDTPELRAMNRRIEIVNWDEVSKTRQGGGATLGADSLPNSPAAEPQATPQVNAPAAAEGNAAATSQPAAQANSIPTPIDQTGAAEVTPSAEGTPAGDSTPAPGQDNPPRPGWEMYQNNNRQ